jgi:SAM-dependent methyltransferase
MTELNLDVDGATQLPFPDKSFDLVFTALALEQMEEIRLRALSEIGRVARTHTAMIEPFYDWNESGRHRDWVVANDNFSGRIADLPSFGLEPILVSGNMPSKVTNRPGLVVCRVR